jgi:hypothetical protein
MNKIADAENYRAFILLSGETESISITRKLGTDYRLQAVLAERG